LHLILSANINNIIVKDAYDCLKLIRVEGICVWSKRSCCIRRL